ncbi:glycosyltransferase family 2 protein [Sphingosinicellaceae bacterium]|nr:glycosyltransferase family 2 protein [Sphingosinicellaceae bacterium]
MKLIVQIPCFNEEATLAQTVADIPRKIPGVDVVEILVIDDGSSDRTVEVARDCGVDYIVRSKHNVGLGLTFRTGLDTALALGADIIVNTDGDNQYFGGDIPKLIEPILAGRADVVVGDRETSSISHFSGNKRRLQTFGSRVVRRLSGVVVPDAVSGFRAISREAAFKLNILSKFSYTIEMLIQVGTKRISYASVPIRSNAKTRESRLFKGIRQFITRQAVTTLRMYSMYQPLRVFGVLGLAAAVTGLIPIVRFVIYYAMGEGEGKIQGLVIGGALLIVGLLTLLLGLIADLINHNRQLIEITLEKVRLLEDAQRGTAARPHPVDIKTLMSVP